MARNFLKLLSLCIFTVLVTAAGINLIPIPHAPAMYVYTSGNSSEKSPIRGVDETDSLLLFADFENNATDWMTVDLTALMTWHRDDYNAYGSSGQSWWVGDTLLNGYDNEWLQYLVSPALNLTGSNTKILEFDAFWAVESSNGPPPPPPPFDGYDGANVWISTNGGANWSVLSMQSPAYDAANLGSFAGPLWGITGPIPGWTGFSGGTAPGTWVHCVDTLPPIYNVANVKLRWGFASDEEISTHEQSNLTGFFVDNVNLHDASQTYLENNGEGFAFPGELVPTTGMIPAGNLWHLAAVNFPPAPTPTHVMRLGNANEVYVPRMKDALVSPRIDLREYSSDSSRITLDFYIRGSINIGDPDTTAEGLDYWTVQISPDSGRNWYYYNNPYGLGDSNKVAVDVDSNYTLFSQINGDPVDLTPYCGHDVRMRILFVSNSDAYTGTGLYVDNVVVSEQRISQHDAAARNLWIPMPTSAYLNTIHATVEIQNRGLSAENNIPVYWHANTIVYPLSFPDLQPNTSIVLPFDWTTPAPGSYTVYVNTMLQNDTIRGNDTSRAGVVEVTPANLLEFGYDNRQYSYQSLHNFFAYNANSGACVRFTPSADGITVPLNALQLKAKFENTGTIRVHLYQAGTSFAPGAEITNFDVSVTTTYNNGWQTIPLGDVSYLQNNNTNFWVWFEVTSPAQDPKVTGAPTVHGQGHFFTKTGSNVQATDYDFFVRADFQPALGVENPEPAGLPLTFKLGQNSPNPFNPATAIPYALPHSAQVKLMVFDVSGRLVATLQDGWQAAGYHQALFDASGLSSGIYLYRLSAGEFSATGKMALLK